MINIYLKKDTALTCAVSHLFYSLYNPNSLSSFCLPLELMVSTSLFLLSISSCIFSSVRFIAPTSTGFSIKPARLIFGINISLGYLKECNEFHNMHKTGHDFDSDTGFLSGMNKSDRIHPIITLIFYYGESPWDSPVTLSGMMTDIPEELRPFFSDYKINLIQILDSRHYQFYIMKMSEVYLTLRRKYMLMANVLAYKKSAKQQYHNSRNDYHIFIKAVYICQCMQQP